MLRKDPNRSGAGALLVEFQSAGVSIPEYDAAVAKEQKAQRTESQGAIEKSDQVSDCDIPELVGVPRCGLLTHVGIL